MRSWIDCNDQKTSPRRPTASKVFERQFLLITMLPDINPQSTGRATPVIAEAASDARKPTALATSIRLDDAAKRIPAPQRFQDLGILGGAPLPDWRAYGAWQHDIGADAMTAIFLRERAGERDHRRLAGAVGWIAKRAEAVDRTDVDDDARTFGHHARDDGLSAVIGAVQIDFDLLPPSGGIGAGQGSVGRAAGVVDENVDWPQRAGQRRECALDLRGFADIGDSMRRKSRVGLEFGGETLDTRLLVDSGDLGALVEK